MPTTLFIDKRMEEEEERKKNPFEVDPGFDMSSGLRSLEAGLKAKKKKLEEKMKDKRQPYIPGE
jgi:hypothetical protein